MDTLRVLLRRLDVTDADGLCKAPSPYANLPDAAVRSRLEERLGREQAAAEAGRSGGAATRGVEAPREPRSRRPHQRSPAPRPDDERSASDSGG